MPKPLSHPSVLPASCLLAGAEPCTAGQGAGHKSHGRAHTGGCHEEFEGELGLDVNGKTVGGEAGARGRTTPPLRANIL